MAFFKNIFGRSSRVVKGQINQGMEAIEDATFESTLKQSVRDMKEELNKVVKASAAAMSNYNRLEAEYQNYARQADEWKQRAVKALEAGREELAKKALAKKSECEEQVGKMQTSVDSARETSEKLKSRIIDLKKRIQEAERNAGTLIARRNAARAQKKVAQALAGVGEAENAFAALNHFEEKVNRDEAEANAFDNLAETDADKSLEAEFAELQTSTVDADLEALKRELGKA